MAILVGARAPDFTLPGWYHRAADDFTLSREHGRVVVLAFYPGDERIVCTRQLCSYSDNLGDLHLFDATVWGISPELVDTHRRFAEGRKLRMPLLADVDRAVARSYGVVGPLGLRRSVFVVDATGHVAWRWVSSALNLSYPTVDVLREALTRARVA